jgi:hypothetical protein
LKGIKMAVKKNEDEKVKAQALKLCESVDTIKVVDHVGYEKASDFLGLLKENRKVIVQHFKDMKANAHKTWKSIVAKENEYTAPIDAVESKVKKLMIVFVNEQNEIKRLAEQKALKEAQAKEQKERERLAKVAQKARDKADELLKQGNEDKAQALIEKAEEAEEKKEEVYSEPVAVANSVSKTTKTGSTTTSTSKKLEITLPEAEGEIKAFCKAVAEGTIPTNCIKFSLKEITSWAKAWNKTGRVCGLVIRETSGIIINKRKS